MPSRPLDKYGREKKSDSSWLVGENYLKLKTMLEWGLSPKTWRNHSVQDRTDMLAYCRVKNRMESADNKQMESKMNSTKQQSQPESNRGKHKRWH